MRGNARLHVNRGEQATHRRFKDGAYCSPEPNRTGPWSNPVTGLPQTPACHGLFTGHRRGDDCRPARRGERHHKHEPEVEPIIISDASARFTVVLSLALFTIGAALLIWRGLSPISEGDHWIDQVMEAIRAFSTFAAMMLVLYLVFAARVFSEGTEEQLRLRYQHGLAEGWNQAVQRFGHEAPDVWKAWTEWKELAEATRMEGWP